MYDISPALYNDGFEMFAYWESHFQPGERKTIRTEFTHFSGFGCCCNCTHGGSRFEYDISYMDYWNTTTKVHVKVKNLYRPSIETSLDTAKNGPYICLSGNNYSKPIGIEIHKPPLSIKGYVYEINSTTPIIDAKLVVNGTQINITTDKNGYFELVVWSKGRYTVNISKAGYDFMQEVIVIDYYNGEKHTILNLKQNE